MTLSFQNKIQPSANSLSFASKVQPTIQPITTPPLDASTKADQATFAATGNEGALGIAAKTVGNIPSSTVGFVKSTFDFLNPFNTVKTAQQIGASIGGALNEGQKLTTLAKDTLYGLPKAAVQTLVPQFLQHIGSGDLTKAAATLENDPIGQILPLLFVARTAAQKAGVGTQFDSAISTIASPVTKTASGATGFTKNVTSGALKFGTSQLTGLSPQTLEQAISNPSQFSKEAQSMVNRPSLAENINTAIKDRQSALSDTGVGYTGIRTMTEPIPVSPSYLDKLIYDTTKLTIKEGGKLEASGSAKIRLPSDVNALQNKIYNIWKPEFDKGYLTPDQFLNLRADLSKMAYNDSGIGKSTELSKLSEIMRAKVNTDIRPNIPGLAEVDTKYAPQVSELTQLSRGLVDNAGNLTDMAINRIANATGKGKDPQLARLEQLSPGITDKIKILKAVEDIQNSRENKPGTYLRAGALGAGIVTLNPYIIVSAIMSLPEVAIPLMRGLGYSSDIISKTLNTLGISQGLSDINKFNTPAPVKEFLKKPKIGLSIEDVSKNNPLAQEAQKYKSAEFSVQQKGMAELSLKVAKEHGVQITPKGDLVLYHGTKVGRAPKAGDNWRVGSYFTSDPKVAEQFANQGSGGKVKIIKVEVPPHTVFPSGDGTYYTLNERIPVKYEK